MTFDVFEPGDRVELVRHYSLSGDPPPQGIVVGKGYHCVRCKMDRTGKVIRFKPEDLRKVR